MSQAYSYIRFSTEKQALGDSLRRQLEEAQKYAALNNLTLDTHSFKDLGVSAFKSKNLKEGALGVFLEAVDKGLIPSNATLLVESLDRISRAEPTAALPLFISIVNRGLTIVTLIDKQVYTKERINQDNGMSLFGSMMVMLRAHEESKTKSTRVAAGIMAKRATMSVNGNCPSWLSVNDDRTGYVRDEEKVATIQKIFELSYQGKGIVVINDYLVANEVPQIGKAKTVWSPLLQKNVDESYKAWLPQMVARLLHNQAVLGHLYSPKHDTLIEGYYGKGIVPKEMFLEVQEKMTLRQSVGRGAKGKNVANVFSGLGVCGDCGAKMRYSKKTILGPSIYEPSIRAFYGKPPLRLVPYSYLVCESSFYKKGCTAPPLNYQVIEKKLLEWLLLFKNIEFRTEQKALYDPSLDLRADILVKNKQIQGLMDTLEQLEKDRQGSVIDRLNTRQDELKVLEKRLLNSVVPRATQDVLKEAQDVFNKHMELQLQPPSKSTDLYDIRMRLQHVIKEFVERIDFPSKLIEGSRPKEFLREAVVTLRPQWKVYLQRRDIDGFAKDMDGELNLADPELIAMAAFCEVDVSEFSKEGRMATHIANLRPTRLKYKVPSAGNKTGNRRGRPRKKAPEVS